MKQNIFDALVIGGGINGLSTLYHLERLGCRRSGLLEQFDAGHEWGSSHGQSRVSRTAYIDPVYIRLMQVVRTQEWPRLERDACVSLIHPTPGCFFGPPGGKQENYAKANAEVGANVEEVDAKVASKRFPQFDFQDGAHVLLDHDAALVAAADTVYALTRIAEEKQLPIHKRTKVTSIDLDQNPVLINTNTGTYQTERLVVTAGPWSSELLPFLKPDLKVARQTVGYFEMAGDPEDYRIPNFPVWGNLGEEHQGVYYGLPEFGRKGMKIARHVTAGLDDDPNEYRDAAEVDIRDLRQFIEEQFRDPVAAFIDSETCLYTNTATEDFIIDQHPNHPNVAIGAGFSGHGFKFGPLTGRILAELAMNGTSTVTEFEAARDRFSIDRATVQ